MNKFYRHFQNGISLFATIIVPTRKAVISVSSAVDPLSSDCIEVARIIQIADLALPITLVVHVDSDNTHVEHIIGAIVVKKGSLRSIFYALISRLSIVTHGLHDVGPFVNFKTVVFNVWHGAPLKKIGYHSKVTPEQGRLKNINRVWDYLVVPSEAWVTLFSEAFGLSTDKILPIGYPRYNSLGHSKRYKAEKQVAMITYLPTYREGISDFAVYDFIRDPKFLRFLELNEVNFKVRFHPIDRDIEKDIPDDFLYPKHTTTEEMIAQSDLLVTDCSSVIVDAAAMGIETSLYFPDFAHVEKRLGGFYHDFPGELFLSGGASFSMEDIISEFLQSGIGNYNLPLEVIPCDDFRSTFVRMLPVILE